MTHVVSSQIILIIETLLCAQHSSLFSNSHWLLLINALLTCYRGADTMQDAISNMCVNIGASATACRLRKWYC